MQKHVLSIELACVSAPATDLVLENGESEVLGRPAVGLPDCPGWCWSFGSWCQVSVPKNTELTG